MGFRIKLLLIIIFLFSLSNFVNASNSNPLCGDTITTSVTLTGDLKNASGGTVCPGDGLIIGAPNIFLDCNGFGINGNDTGTGIVADTRIYSNLNNISIKNCFITNHLGGIFFYSLNNSVVHNNIIINVTGGIVLGTSSNNTVSSNTIKKTKDDDYTTSIGISISQSTSQPTSFNKLINNSVNHFGVAFLELSKGNFYEDNYATRSGTGFSVYNSDLRNNRADFNVYGFELFGNSILLNNTAENNMYDGFRVISPNNIIINNSAKDNSGAGFRLYQSRNNTLISNKAIRNGYDTDSGGFYIDREGNNTLISNIAEDNKGSGNFVISSSSNNTLDSNIIYKAVYGLVINGISGYNIIKSSSIENNSRGIHIEDISINNTIINNTITYNADGMWISGSNAKYNIIKENIFENNYGAIELQSTSNNQVINNIFYNDKYIALYVALSSFNTITNNIFNNNYRGLSFSSSPNNTIYMNVINNTALSGIYLSNSNGTSIFNNIFNNNSRNAVDFGNNFWNITKTPGPNIIGGPFIAGNFWSDYSGVDINGDGIGDTNLPYNSNGNITFGGDFAPLVTPGFADLDYPIVSLISPLNGTTLNYNNVTFEYNVSDVTSGIASCSIYINGILNQTNTTITEGSTQYFTQILSYSNYTWQVRCVDDSNLSNIGISETRVLRINTTIGDVDTPIITLISPENNFIQTTRNITKFTYTVNDTTSEIASCSLMINGSVMIRVFIIEEEIPMNFYQDLGNGNYTWQVSCTDNSTNANIGNSEIRNLVVNVPDPILLIHGIFGSYKSFDSSMFENQGFDVYILDYNGPIPKLVHKNETIEFTQFEGISNESNGDIASYAHILSHSINEVKQRANVQKVDIVTHSMGGLIARWYINKGNYNDDIRKLIMIGTPNHGSDIITADTVLPKVGIITKLIKAITGKSLIEWATGPAGQQMKPHSSFLFSLNLNNGAAYHREGTDYLNPFADVQYYSLEGWFPIPTLIHSHKKILGIDFKVPDFTIEGDGIVAWDSAKLDEVSQWTMIPLFNSQFHIGEGENVDIINKAIQVLRSSTQLTQIERRFDNMQQNDNLSAQWTELIDGTITTTPREHSITLDNATKKAYFILVWMNGSNNLSLSLITPSNITINSSSGIYDNHTKENIFELYEINNPESGLWKLNVYPEFVSGSENYSFQVFYETDMFIAVGTDNESYNQRQTVKINSFVQQGDARLQANEIKAFIIKPDYGVVSLDLFDDGLHNDFNASDGIYGNSYDETNLVGIYGVDVVANITTNETGFIRQANSFFFVESLPYICGDVNANGAITSSDIIYLVNYVFKSGPAPKPIESGDANNDSVITSADIIYLVNYVFKSGPAPVCSSGGTSITTQTTYTQTELQSIEQQLADVGITIDITPPVRSNGKPTGTLSSSTTSTTISLTTDEISTCKYSTVSNVLYDYMTNSFSAIDATSHSKLMTGLSSGKTYNYYVKCKDSAGNKNSDDYLISFSISSGKTAPKTSSFN